MVLSSKFFRRENFPNFLYFRSTWGVRKRESNLSSRLFGSWWGRMKQRLGSSLCDQIFGFPILFKCNCFWNAARKLENPLENQIENRLRNQLKNQIENELERFGHYKVTIKSCKLQLVTTYKHPKSPFSTCMLVWSNSKELEDLASPFNYMNNLPPIL